MHTTSITVRWSDLPASVDPADFLEHLAEAVAFDPEVIAEADIEESADGFVLTVLAEATAEEVLEAVTQTYGPA